MVAAALAACLIGTHTQAEIILGEHDWENGAEGWAMLGSETWVTVEDPAVGENWLNIALTGQTASWSTVVKVQAEDLFAGTWTPDMFVEFDFWAEDVTPDVLQLRWSSTTNSETWSYSLNAPTETDIWTAQSAPLSHGTDWIFSGGGSPEDQYLSDLSSIDWIGIYVEGSSAVNQSYQLDNFRLMIPEPSQYVMLSSAILTCLAAVRRRKNDTS
jgi:hypothetical protein